VSLTSWGGLPAEGQLARQLEWPDQLDQALPGAGLAVGCGRSYGDVGLAANGTVLQLTGLNRLLSFDKETGVLRCEAGVTLKQILAQCLRQGWLLPVLPGTSQVSVGGAIANDVHGKNHHREGTFGCHVRELLLARSDGSVLTCSPGENADWYSATVGGLGLTGVILEAELQLQPVAGAYLETDTIRFESLAEFFQLSDESEQTHAYTVAWIDCLSRETRGHFSRANHSPQPGVVNPPQPMFSVPWAPPVSPVNRLSLRLFNSLYFHRQRSQRKLRRESLYPWFFPLDRVGHWNRLYGSRGFRQYQCVVPAQAVADLLAIIRNSGEGSFLAVLKMFGRQESPGLLSFPRPGATLALDFPWRGSQTLDLFKRLDAVVAASGGAIYPAKDAHMSGADFRRAYPAWEQLEQLRDPALNSLFWQRVTGSN